MQVPSNCKWTAFPRWNPAGQTHQRARRAAVLASRAGARLALASMFPQWHCGSASKMPVSSKVAFNQVPELFKGTKTDCSR